MDDDQEKTPRRIGRYEVAGCIAHRPFEDGSDVYLAVDALRSGASKVIVVKRLAASLTTRSASVDEYLTVANRVSKKLHHPNVVEIRAAAREGNDVFVVMDYMMGETLASVTHRTSERGETIDPATAAYIISEACGGLYAAKAAELVHGCLTPYDIFIGYDGAVRVLDIGTAAAKTQLAGGQLRDFELLYTSPDRVYNENVDRKSDVFSMGAILYELLAGFSPFEASDRADTTRAICDEPIAAPITVAPKAPQEMSDVVLRALTRDHKKRPDEIALRKLLSGSIGPSARRELEVLMARLFERRVKDKKELVHKLANKSGNETVDLGKLDFEDRIYPAAVRVQPAMVPPAIELASSPVEPLAEPVQELQRAVSAPAVEAPPPVEAAQTAYLVTKKVSRETAPFFGAEEAPSVAPATSGDAAPAAAAVEPAEVAAAPPPASTQEPASDRAARPISSPRAAVASTRMLAAEPIAAEAIPVESVAAPANVPVDRASERALRVSDAASTKELAAQRASANVEIAPESSARPLAVEPAPPADRASERALGVSVPAAPESSSDAASTKELAAQRASANVPVAPESSARPLTVEPAPPVDRASERALDVSAPTSTRAPLATQPLGGADLAHAAATALERRDVPPSAPVPEPVPEAPVSAVVPEPLPSRPPPRTSLRPKGGPNISVRSMLFFAGIGAVVVVAIVMLQSGPKTNDAPIAPASTSAASAIPSTAVTTPEPPTSSSSKITSKSSAPTSSADRPKKEETVIVIETVPAHAGIFVAGAKVGTSPFELKVPKSTAPVIVEVRHQGYVTLKERVIPNANQRLKLSLTKAAPASSSPYRRVD